MRNENDFRQIVAENISKYRKANNLTQFQLAEKLNYSDKAISKWERGESLPDLYMLATIAEMFGITVNDLMEKEIAIKLGNNKLSKTVVTWLSFGLAWLVAFISFAVFMMIPALKDWAWICLIYGIPASIIVLVVFYTLRNVKLGKIITISLLFYTIPLAVCCQLGFEHNSPILFVIAAPLQVLTILWFVRKNDIKAPKVPK